MSHSNADTDPFFHFPEAVQQKEQSRQWEEEDERWKKKNDALKQAIRTAVAPLIKPIFLLEEIPAKEITKLILDFLKPLELAKFPQIMPGPIEKTCAAWIFRLVHNGKIAAAIQHLNDVKGTAMEGDVSFALQTWVPAEIVKIFWKERQKTCPALLRGDAPCDSAEIGQRTQLASERGHRGETRHAEETDINSTLRGLKREILQALGILKATNDEKRATGETIAGKIGGGATGQSVKAPLADLKRQGFVDSKTGRDGGTWLISRGLDFINSLPPKQ